MDTMKQKGFTLIELLLVLVILAALSAIVVPKFTNRSKDAKITAARVDITNIEGAIDAFEIDTSRYPTNTEGLRALIIEPSNLNENEWKGPLLEKGHSPKTRGVMNMFISIPASTTSTDTICIRTGRTASKATKTTSRTGRKTNTSDNVC